MPLFLHCFTLLLFFVTQKLTKAQICPGDTFDPADFSNAGILPSDATFELDLLTDVYADCIRFNLQAWSLGLPDGAKTLGVDEIDFTYFQCKEDFITQGYVLLEDGSGEVSDGSGVTIASGVDLGTTDRATLSSAGVDDSVLDQLDPYFGLTDTAAAQKLCEEGPLQLTKNEAQNLTYFYVEGVTLPAISTRYDTDRDSNSEAWDSLPQCYRTVIHDVYFINGDEIFTDVSQFWDYVTDNDWESLAILLRVWAFAGAPTSFEQENQRYFHLSRILESCGECTSSIDLAFLVDGSGSVDSGEFAETLQFVADVVEQMDNGTQVGLSQFATSYQTEFTMSAYNLGTASGRNSAISRILSTFKLGGGTNLGSAITFFAAAQFEDGSGVRPASQLVPRVAMIMTDGRSQDDPGATKSALTDLDVTIITIGIGNYDLDQLTSISELEDIKFLDDFDELVTIIDSVSVISCTASASLDSMSTQSDIVQLVQNEIARYRVDGPGGRRRLQTGDSLVVTVNQTSGCVYVYASYCNEYTNPFDFDYAHEACEVSTKQIIVPFYNLMESCTVTELFVNVEGIQFGTNEFTIAVSECDSSTDSYCVPGVNYIFDDEVDDDQNIGDDIIILNSDKECVVDTEVVTDGSDPCSSLGTEAACVGFFGLCEWVDVTTAPNGGGDPEYISLDNRKFKYDGPGKYLLTTNDKQYCSNIYNYKHGETQNHIFTIMSQHGRTGSRQKHIVIIDKVFINLDNKYEIEIQKNNQILINNVTMKNNNTKLNNGEILILKKLSKNSRGIALEENIFIKTTYGLIIRVVISGIGQIWVQVPKYSKVCGLLGNNNGNYFDDIILKNGNTIHDFNQESIDIMGDSWMISYKNQPCICDLYPENSYSKFKECQYDRFDVENKCNNYIDYLLSILGGKWIDQCFNNYENNLIDATRLYDNCITEICHVCQEKDVEKCQAEKVTQSLRNVCKENGIQTTF